MNHYTLVLGIEVGFILGNENLESHHVGHSPCKSQSGETKCFISWLKVK